MLTLTLLLACSAPDGQDPSTTGRVTAEDLAELLDRVEELEAEVVALRNTGAPVGIDADADGDGLREWDGLPVGTKLADVLYDWTCSAEGEVPPAAPDWLLNQWSAWDADGRLVVNFVCWSFDGAAATGWYFTPPPRGGFWAVDMKAEDVGSYRIQCLAI